MVKSDALKAARGATVLVRVEGPDTRGERTEGRPFFRHLNGTTALSCTGIVLDAAKGLVVVPLGLLAPFLTWPGDDVLKAELDEGVDVGVLVEGGRRPLFGTLVAVADAEMFREGLVQMTQESSRWSCGWLSSDGASMPHTSLSRLGNGFNNDNMCVSGVALLRIPQLPGAGACTAKPSKRRVARGQSLYHISSPFGLVAPRVFHNSVGTTSVSNIVLDAKRKSLKLIVADVRTLPGAEGSGLFDSAGNIIAMIMFPLRHDAHPIEFSVAVPFDHLRRIFLSNLVRPSISAAAASASTQTIDEVGGLMLDDASVVMVSMSQLWGSGVILSASGYIVTNAHVVKPFLTSLAPPRIARGVHLRIRLNDANLTWLEEAEIVWVSRSHWDLALIKVNVPRGVHLKPVDYRPMEQPYDGQRITVVGHGVLGPSCDMRASYTEGLVGRTVIAAGQPILLHCNAVVNQGCSGGAIFHSDSGRFIGLIASNARHHSNTIIPRINFSLPSTILQPLVRFVRGDGADRTLLALYDEADDETQMLWQPGAIAYNTFGRTRLARSLETNVMSKL